LTCLVVEGVIVWRALFRTTQTVIAAQLQEALANSKDKLIQAKNINDESDDRYSTSSS